MCTCVFGVLKVFMCTMEMVEVLRMVEFLWWFVTLGGGVNDCSWVLIADQRAPPFFFSFFRDGGCQVFWIHKRLFICAGASWGFGWV